REGRSRRFTGLGRGCRVLARFPRGTVLAFETPALPHSPVDARGSRLLRNPSPQRGCQGARTMTELKPIETRRCGVDGCARPYLCKGYCRLHWERQHNTGTTADPEGPRGPKNPSWKGEGATYSSVHARMCRTPHPAACETCRSEERRVGN